MPIASAVRPGAAGRQVTVLTGACKWRRELPVGPAAAGRAEPAARPRTVLSYHRPVRSLRVVALSIVFGAFASTARAQLPIVELGAGMHLIRAELAADDPSRMQGLMFRKSLGQNEGMLFVFDEVTTHCMWMKNTFVPLSVAFLDASARIVNIADMTPQSEESHCASQPARYALEMRRGWFAERGIGPGFTIRGPGAQMKRGPRGAP